MTGGILSQLGTLFLRRYGRPPAPPAPPAQPTPPAQQGSGTLSQQGASWPQAPQAATASDSTATATSAPSGAAEQRDPIVANLNQQLAAEQAQPVPTEDEALQREQHQAWGNYDFERCIVIFSRLRELHPDDPNWADKLKVSYFNRGKQYENESNEERAIACYYSALSIDPEFPEAKEAAQALLERSQS
jgi:hypothetical protein